MKKILFFFIFLFLLGCAADKQQYNIVSCPDILFSKENRVYITSTQEPITNENLDYRAIINNVDFSKECLVSNNILETKLSLLFLRDNNPEVAVIFNQGDLEIFENRIRNISYEIKKGEFTAKKGKYCDWCDYQNLICPLFG